MTELDILMLQAQNNQSTGAYQIALAFSVWVAFRVSSAVSSDYSDNIAAKIAGTAFGLSTLFFFAMTYAFWDFNMQSTGHRLALLASSGTEISALSQAYVANIGATTTPPTFSLITTSPVAVILQLSILALIVTPIWGPKKAA